MSAMSDPTPLRPSPLVEVVEMTPAQAELLLSHNVDNRKLRERVVAQYANAMRRGEWILSNDMIVVYSDGRLGNGQHRLEAIVESGVTVPLMVMRNASDEMHDIMDIGARRSFGDVLRRRGELSVAVLAGAVRQLWLYRAGRPLGNVPGVQPTHGELVAALDADPGIREFVNPARVLRHELGVPESIGVTLLYLFNEQDPESQLVFYRQLLSGTGLDESNPIRALRRQLTLVTRSGVGSRGVNTRRMAALMILAWNYWQEGREVAHLRWRTGGPHPMQFPRITSVERRAQ